MRDGAREQGQTGLRGEGGTVFLLEGIIGGVEADQVAPAVTLKLVATSLSTSAKAMVASVKYGPRRRKTMRPMTAAKIVATIAARNTEIHLGTESPVKSASP